MNFFSLGGNSVSNFKKWTEKWPEKINAIESQPRCALRRIQDPSLWAHYLKAIVGCECDVRGKKKDEQDKNQKLSQIANL